MRVAIVGSRDYPTPALIQVVNYLKTLDHQDIIVTGGAIGVDQMAEVYAREDFGMTVTVYPAQWGRYGREAGKVRNVQIIQGADRVVAFWFQRSAGTYHTLKCAKIANLPIEIHTPDGRVTAYDQTKYLKDIR